MIDLANTSLLTGTLIAMGLSLILMVVVPILPGQFIIWLAALIYGFASGWETLSGGVFFVLTILMVVAAIIDLIAGWIEASTGGASWPAIVLGLVLGLVGLVVFNAIGAIVGSIVGIVGYEYYLDGNWGRSWKAATGYLGGMLVSLVVRFLISVAMVAIFVWQVI